MAKIYVHNFGLGGSPGAPTPKGEMTCPGLTLCIPCKISCRSVTDTTVAEISVTRHQRTEKETANLI